MTSIVVQLGVDFGERALTELEAKLMRQLRGRLGPALSGDVTALEEWA